MNILMVYPMYPDTFWSFKHALKFVSKKASFPPLGLLTVAALLPADWNIRLIDMNINKLKDKEIVWADYVFISAMSIQSDSVESIITQCRRLNAKTVAGGPLFTGSPDKYKNIDHLVLNEAEITLPLFLTDLQNNNPQPIYTTDKWADITTTPMPRWDLISGKNYTSMNLQYSRGCPYECDFCDITVLYGRKPRTKNGDQVLNELKALHDTGWRGPVFFVDDNFIGNKAKLKKEILPAIVSWNIKMDLPFEFNTEASINLADDDELLQLMAEARFDAVFIGIESPNDESLIECSKTQNRNRNLIGNINKIQKAGLEVQGGFIVGFDKDQPAIFDELTEFIQQSGIVTAMVGLLNAPNGTKLHKKLTSQGRMLKDFTGSNTDFSINFIPRMQYTALMNGYKKVLSTIYSPPFFYERMMRFMKNFNPKNKKALQLNPGYIMALFKSIVKLGIIGEERMYYWKVFFWTLFKKPKLFSLSILFMIYGYHFRKVSNSFP